MKLTSDINKNIFREYDIRGVYPSDINEDVAYTIGRAFGSYIRDFGEESCVVAHDNRYSSEELTNALMKGICASGVNVLYLGLTTTPMYYFGCINIDSACGIMVTASHNPKDDNGFKIAFEKGGNAKGKEISDFYDYVMRQDFKTGAGIISRMDVKEDYIKYLCSSINIKKPLKAVIDCGNGTTTILVNDVFNMENIEFVTLYGKSDPSFPNHHPDPAVDENLRVLCNAVVELKADVGLAFDGDGDRLGVVDNSGRIVRVDKWLALLARDIIKNSDNHRFLYDVKCGMSLIKELEKINAEGVMVRTGNSYTRKLTREHDCILGGEYSGHVYFRDKFAGFDSGMYAGLRILEMLSKSDETLSEMVDSLEKYYSTGEMKFKTRDEIKFEIVDKIKDYADSKGYKYSFIDGVRVQFEDDSWVSVRASNTGPHLTMRVEARDEDRLNKLIEEFENVVLEYNK